MLEEDKKMIDEWEEACRKAEERENRKFLKPVIRKWLITKKDVTQS